MPERTRILLPPPRLAVRPALAGCCGNDPTDLENNVTSDTFTLEPTGIELEFRRVTLIAREWLTPSYVRVRLESPGLAGFTSLGADDHIRIFFPEGDPQSVEELRAAPSREYTPLTWGDDWLDLSSRSTAIPRPAPQVSPLLGRRPRRSVRPRASVVLAAPRFSWGTPTRISSPAMRPRCPPIRRFAQAMDADAVGLIVVETTDAAHALAIDTPAGVVVEHVHRCEAPGGSALASRLNALTPADRPAGAVFGFVAAEQSIVKPGHALLLERWGLDSGHVIVKGYWKRGETKYHAPH